MFVCMCACISSARRNPTSESLDLALMDQKDLGTFKAVLLKPAVIQKNSHLYTSLPET